MDFDFSFEQRLLAESVGKALAAFAPVTERPPFPYAAHDVLGALAQLGLFGDEDGPALGHADAVAVAIESGRHLVAAPVIEALATSLAVPDARVAAGLLSGHAVGVAVSGYLSHGGAGFTGKVLLPFGAATDLALVPVQRASGIAWHLFDAHDLQLEPAETSDITVEAVWAGVRAEMAPPPPLAADGLSGSLQLLAMAETVGTAAACLDITAGYIRERTQFGKPIGSYQAVKHMAADAAVAVETMKAAVEYTGWCLDQAAADADAGAEAALALLTARSFVGQHAKAVVERCIQMHGGIAFTWDYGLHRHLRRVLYRTHTIIRLLDGRDQLAALILAKQTGAPA